MPLSKPAPRKLLHTRTVVCRGYEREDGLWDIEGHMTDVKSYSFQNRERGEIKAGEPVHGMWIRLTLDEHMLVHDAEACTDWSPFGICPEITERYKQLIGLHIGPGWNSKVKQLFSGVAGCTHLTELLGPMATTAFQTLLKRRQQQSETEAGAHTNAKRPRIIDSCHAFASAGDVVKINWPQFYTGADRVADD